MTTLDAYAQQANLSRIDLLSVDTAGNDVAVLKGASGLLRDQRIAVILLDHNEFWVYAGLFLRDAFRLLEPLGYRLGRLGPEGIDFCKHYNSSLETFAAKMFVACTKDAAKRLPHGSGLQFVPSTATSYWL